MGRWRHAREPREPEADEEVGTASASGDVTDERVPNDASGDHEDAPVRASRDATRRVQEVRMDRADDSPEVSVVGPGTRVEGTVAAAGSLRVDGEVKGRITAAKDVVLTARGRVEANIEATSITLAGQVRGNLTARGDVSLPADSRLEGDIRARNVNVGGAVKGDIVGSGKVELGPHARVEGDISSRALVVAEGAVFIGASVMGDQEREGAARG